MANSILIAIIFVIVRVLGEKNRSAIENLETAQLVTKLTTRNIDENKSVFSKNRSLRQQAVYPTTEKSGNLPSVFLIGAQKGGTSSLFELLVKHPSMCRGFHKESHYFSFDKDGIYDKGTDFYKKMYLDKKCDGINGTFYIDGTPILHNNPANGESVWDRIYNTYNISISQRDHLKFIAILREPVSRDYSWYQHSTRWDLASGLLFTDMKTMAERNTQRAFERNIQFTYVHQLANFAKVFNRSQLMVISSADMFTNTASVMERIRIFLNVTSDRSFSQKLPHDDHLNDHHESDKGTAFVKCLVDHVPKLDCSERDRLGTFYEKYNQELYQFLNSSKGPPSESPFWPHFDSHTSISCSNDTRKEMKGILELDALNATKC